MQKPISHIDNLHTLVLVRFLAGAGEEQLWISVPDSQQRIDLALECVGIVYAVRDLDIDLFIALDVSQNQVFFKNAKQIIIRQEELC